MYLSATKLTFFWQHAMLLQAWPLCMCCLVCAWQQMPRKAFLLMFSEHTTEAVSYCSVDTAAVSLASSDMAHVCFFLTYACSKAQAVIGEFSHHPLSLALDMLKKYTLLSAARWSLGTSYVNTHSNGPGHSIQEYTCGTIAIFVSAPQLFCDSHCLSTCESGLRCSLHHGIDGSQSTAMPGQAGMLTCVQPT
jgi:hypothetical protein